MWGSFEISDIDLNNIPLVSDFVTKFEQELDSEPGLPPDVCCFLDLPIFFLKLTGRCRRVLFSTSNVSNSQPRDAYFGFLEKTGPEDGPPEQLTSENESHEERK
jgi:hypothetical protein